MWYLIRGHEAPDALALRRAARSDHVARLAALRDAGRLLVAGPIPAIDAVDPGPAGFRGSTVIAEFDSLNHAREWAEQDPYIARGVWISADVDPFVPVLP